jgi:hypothetical protein
VDPPNSSRREKEVTENCDHAKDMVSAEGPDMKPVTRKKPSRAVIEAGNQRLRYLQELAGLDKYLPH